MLLSRSCQIAQTRSAAEASARRVSGSSRLPRRWHSQNVSNMSP
jgi:hypothetical protein